MEKKTDERESDQYLTFKLGDESFAFNVLKTNEVLEYTRITRVPGSSGAMVGVINLRGGVVPVIDLRKKLGMPKAEVTVDTAIVILDTQFAEDKVVIGVLVDAAKQVIMLDKKQLEAPPKVGMKMNIEYITAIGKSDNEFIILLDSDRLFSERELSAAKEVTETQEPSA